MDDTDIAPGVRGSGGRRFVSCLSREGRGESEVGGIRLVEGVEEVSYVDSVRLPEGVLALLSASPDPILPVSLAALEPIFPVETLLGGLTTFNGTDALPAPRLATLDLSPPLSLNPEGRLGASPNDPPDDEGRRGVSSALTWNREILSLIRVVAPVRTALGEGGELERREEEEGEGEDDVGFWRFNLAILSASEPVLGILELEDLFDLLTESAAGRRTCWKSDTDMLEYEEK